MTSDERRRVVQRLASMAQTMAEMGYGEDLARGHLIATFRADVGLEKASTDVGVVREAAARISWLLQPLDRPVQEIEHVQSIREMLGVTSDAELLTAAMTAREWLERLADDLSWDDPDEMSN
jgi:hypothetical protein